MSARSQQSELERVIEALILSFFIYVVYLFVFGASLPIAWNATSTPFGFTFYRVRVVVLLLITALLGLGWGYVKGHDLLARLLRKFKLTERTSRDSVWIDVFVSLSGTVQVGLADGRMLFGWLGRYSDTGDERSLFLEKASWINEDGTLLEIPGSGILLTEKAEIHFVMFLDDSK